MSGKRMAKASALLQLYRAEFGFPFGVPAGIAADKARDLDRHADADLLEWYRDRLAREEAERAASRWVYNGDVNLEYGGTFIDLSDWRHGYASFVKVTDLASACGFEGAILIEHGEACGLDDPERVRQAMRSCGCSARDFNVGLKDGAKAKQAIRHMIADAMISYGHCDYDRQEVVQMNDDSPMVYDGWKANKRLHNADLMGYVKAVHLKD